MSCHFDVILLNSTAAILAAAMFVGDHSYDGFNFAGWRGGCGTEENAVQVCSPVSVGLSVRMFVTIVLYVETIEMTSAVLNLVSLLHFGVSRRLCTTV